MITVFLQPSKGRRVRRADGQLFKPEGESLELTPYLSRLVFDGDLIAIDTPSPAPSPEPAPKSAKRPSRSKGGQPS